MFLYHSGRESTDYFFFSTEAVTICTGHRAAELKPVVLKGLTDMGFQPYPHI